MNKLKEQYSIASLAPLHIGEVLTDEAIAFIVALHKTFNPLREDLLQRRKQVQQQLNAGAQLDFLPETERIRADAGWKVASIPKDLQERKVEITGPVDKKMLINALNSGAHVFMADFEDSLSPTWSNVIEGQANLRAAVAGDLAFTSPEGKEYRLAEKLATLMVRPRGWHLVEKNFLVEKHPISASLFDFGLYFFHNAKELIAKGSGPYFYLPKMEHHLEARLWNEVFVFAQEWLKIPTGTIRATVLIETIPAAFQMEEILFELQEHSAGLNAGRWDYLFSIIKKYQSRQEFVFPDRSLITMTVPFMRAYAQLLVKTCHKRHAHAMGGMAAFIPSRKDQEVNAAAIAKVREDKLREVQDGFDGTWVAHPDLVPVAGQVFQDHLKEQPNQINKQIAHVISAADLTNFAIQGGKITEQGLRLNISIAMQYIAAWLKGSGAVALYNLMEDAATAEISRSQLWQWLHHPEGKLADGRKITLELIETFQREELEKLKPDEEQKAYLARAWALIKKMIVSAHFVDFLTIPAYEEL